MPTPPGTALPARAAPVAPLELQGLARKAASLIEATLAPSTRRAYGQAWRDFCGWAAARELEALPAAPETVALYLTARADPPEGAELGQLSARTLGKVGSAIGKAHELAKQPSPMSSPTVRMVLKGIRRQYGKPARGKKPAQLRELADLVDALPPGPSGVRDRALLLLGWTTALRRSELVALNVEDLELQAEGYVIQLGRSKTDQEGEGRLVGVPRASRTDLCPVSAVQAWLELLASRNVSSSRCEAQDLGTVPLASPSSSNVSQVLQGEGGPRNVAPAPSGPLFRSVDRHGRISSSRLSSRAVALVVKRAARATGHDPERFAGHSLRAGFVTECARLGVPEHEIQAQTGHKSLKVLRTYVRHGKVFTGNAAAKVL